MEHFRPWGGLQARACADREEPSEGAPAVGALWHYLGG